MTDNVIPLKPAEPMVLVCGCGCRSFEVNDDETINCSACGDPASENAGWIKRIVTAVIENPQETFTVERVSDDTPEFLLRLTLKEMGDVQAVAIMRSESVTTWSLPIDTSDRVEWLDRRLADIRSFIMRGKTDEQVE